MSQEFEYKGATEFSFLALMLKYTKSNITAALLDLAVFISNLSVFYHSFLSNSDILSNRILFLAVLLFIFFVFQIVEIFQKITFLRKFENLKYNNNFLLHTTGYVLYKLEHKTRTYKYLSPGFVQLTGYSKNEINKLKFSSIVKKVEVTGKNTADYSNFIDQAIESGAKIFSAEYLIKTKEGSYKWIEDVAIIRKENGKPVGSDGVLRDISKKKNYIASVNEELNNIKKYLEIAEVLFIVLDKDQNLTLANTKTCTVLGYRKNELLGKNWFDSFIPAKEERDSKQAFNNTMIGMQPVQEYFEGIIVDRYNQEHLIGWHNSVIRDNRNNIIAVIRSGIDITKQKKTENSLKFERQLLQTFMDSIPDAIYFKDKESRYIRVGKGIQAFFNNKNASAEIMTDYDYFNTEYAKNICIEDQKILNSGESIINKVEKPLFIDGTRKWVSTTKVPVYNGNNGIVGIAGISRDISEIKKAEESIRENEQRWKSLLENSPISIIIISEGRIVYANSEAVKLAGAVGQNKILGKRAIDFIPVDFRRDFYKLMISFRNGDYENLLYTEAKICNLNGCIIEIEGSAIPVTYMQKDSAQIIFKDISERKRNEKLQKIIAEILHTANSDVDINHFYEFIHCSVKSIMRADNFYIALIDNETSLIHFPYFVDQFDSVPAPIKQGKGLTSYIINGGKPVLQSGDGIENLLKNGIDLLGTKSKTWLGVPLKIQNKIIGAVVVQDYKNESAYTEDDLFLLDTISFPVSGAIGRKMDIAEKTDLITKLKEINSSKDKLFSVISHDLRSPFNALLGFTDILVNDFNSMPQEDLKQYLTYINQTSHNLYSLVNKLLEFSRFQTGKLEFNPVKINIKDLIERNTILLRGNAIKKEIELIYDADEAYIKADEAMINSALQNLISNAIKFTHPGGVVCVKGHKTKTDSSQIVEISVKDTGVGIPPSSMERLFKVDKAFTTSGTAKEPGTGLGLILTHDFIEKNGGTINVKSELKKGTEFVFTLPLFL